MAALLGMLLCALASTTAVSMPPMTPMSSTAARKANQYIFSQRRNNKQGDTRRLDASLEQRCTAMLRHERGTRVGLINLVEPYSGSTALLSLLRQSTELAAICSGGSWQCEHSQAAAELVVAKRPGALLNVPVNMIELLSPSLTDRLNRTGVIAPYRGNLEPPPCGLCANFTELHAFFKKSEGTQQSLVGTECSDAIAEALLSALKWEGQRLVRRHSPWWSAGNAHPEWAVPLSELVVGFARHALPGLCRVMRSSKYTGQSDVTQRGRRVIEDFYIDVKTKLLAVSPRDAVLDQTMLQRRALWLDLSRKVLLLSKVQPFQFWDFLRAGASNKHPQKLPSHLVSAGVTDVLFRAIVMWTPLCMARLASERRKLSARAAIDWTLQQLSHVTKGIRKLRAAGVPTLVVSFADLLWRGANVTARLAAFLPCLGRLDTRLQPDPSADHPGNAFKAHTSIHAFGVAEPEQKWCPHHHQHDIERELARAPGGQQLRRHLHAAERALKAASENLF